jgi:TonB family protein
VLNHAGVDRKKMKCIDVEHSIQPLIKGQVDVLMGYLIDEAVALETSGHPVNVIPGYEHGYVAYSQVYFTSEELLKRDPKLLQKFLEASNRGWRDAFADIPGTAKFVVEKYIPGADLAYQTKSLEKIAAISVRETGIEKLGVMVTERWAEMCVTFEESGILKRPVTVPEIADFGVLSLLYPQPGNKLDVDPKNPSIFMRQPLEYPIRARQKKKEGTVMVNVWFNNTKQPVAVLLESSSGDPLLDLTALKFARENLVTRTPLSGSATVPLGFRLVR